MSLSIDREKAKKTIALILDKIRTEADPLLLAEYRSLFKKEISLFHRSAAAAYLLMLCDQGKSLRFAYPAPKQQVPSSMAIQEGGGDTHRCMLADEESKQLFFSVGRSRRIFPREIIGLITTRASVAKEHIGTIRILDNYSFVQVRDTVAEQIIEALNGIGFRGRPLSVNYAKSRKDEEASEQTQDYTEKEDI